MSASLEVFISYAWKGESEEIVNQLYPTLKEQFAQKNINLIRDKIDLGYKGSIKEFMQRIGAGSYVIVVLSKKYLQSKNCMFELLEVAEQGDFQKRIYPIVLADANIYDAMDRIDYLMYWEEKTKVLEEKMKKVSMQYIASIHEELSLFADIRRSIDKLASTIGDMNTLTSEMHAEANFEQIFSVILEDIQGNVSQENSAEKLDVRVWSETTEVSHVTRDIVMVPKTNHEKFELGKNIVLCCQATQDCFIAVINIGPTGNKTVLHPSQFDSNNFIQANTVFCLPNSSHPFTLTVKGTGKETVRVIASKDNFTVNETIENGGLPPHATEAFYEFEAQ